MGTNYYLNQRACAMCGKGEFFHIGKASAGWCFALRVHPDRHINDLPDWEDAWKRADPIITDEYGSTYSADEMRMIITARYGSEPEREWSTEFLAENHALPGPYGLLRHRIDGSHCVGHGAGTWDLITGEFS